MTDPRDERHARDRFRIRPGELLAILLFWSFLATLTATGRLLDPRIPEISGQLRAALISLAFIEYSLWAVLTIPIVWLVSRLSADAQRRGLRLVLLIVLGIVVAVAVNLIISKVRGNLLPVPPGRSRPGPRGISSIELVGDLIVYFAVLGAALARNYFLEYQARLDETRRLQAETAQLQAQLAEAQLAVLRTQLNPHFLFNTLHAISSLVERDPRGVRRMIARLSELLRHTLEETSEQEITLERELELLKRYLEIMEVRFQGRLQVTIDVDDSVREALVPNLMLQPLVENALKHGVSAIEDPGQVQVRVVRSGDDVVMSVRDNGPGPGDPPGEHGVGLRNTVQRLRQLYGARQRFSLRAASGGGTIAEVSLPYHVAPIR
ncbi:MAG: signal transduction histidine kinase, LytS [Gemmatimonadetes bacterium]|nr:signal transduction histidine kinase, LytS [Gemmatimonadota bacterium]